MHVQQNVWHVLRGRHIYSDDMGRQSGHTVQAYTAHHSIPVTDYNFNSPVQVLEIPLAHVAVSY